MYPQLQKVVTKNFDTNKFDSKKFDSKKFDTKKFDAKKFDTKKFDTKKFDTNKFDKIQSEGLFRFLVIYRSFILFSFPLPDVDELPSTVAGVAERQLDKVIP